MYPSEQLMNMVDYGCLDLILIDENNQFRHKPDGLAM
jgi:hypothetical protein